MWILLGCSPAPAPPAEATAPPLPFTLVPVAKVTQPTAVAFAPGDSDHPFVAEQPGRVRDTSRGENRVVLDIRDRITAGGERGLLGLAFHPAYPADARIFVNYTYTVDDKLRTRIASYRLPAGGVADDEQEILTFDQPHNNHNSGGLTFGPDGFLYLTIGDGGGAGDPDRTGQNPTDLLGSILRIDVSAPPYKVPPDNPFLHTPGARPELWAIGVRNPWGAHFCDQTLWFADVGQNTYEEVNVGVAGANYGWNRLEASHCFQAETCDREGLTAPLAEYTHDDGISVTGGLVYRGRSIPVLDGRYLYADFATGKLWALPTQGCAPRPGAVATVVATLPMNPSTFAEDASHRLYVADYQGTLFRIDP